MNIITLDFETYFDSDYTLKKMTTEEYIRDPRFEVLGFAMRYPANGKTEWRRGPVDQEELMIWADSTILCHHAHFDGLILSHHYGVKPRAWLDTLSMARLLFGGAIFNSLDSLAQHFGLSAKTVPYDSFKGRRWADLSPDVRNSLAAGACHDVELTWQIFNLLAKEFPVEEYPVVDMTVRCFTEPKLQADLNLLGEVWKNEERRKRDIMASLGVTAKELQSADQFAELLRAEGIEPPSKPGKNGPIYAFAKTDPFMTEMLENEDRRLSDLATARLGVKSTIDQTRAERLGSMGSRGPLCVYLNYAGATDSTRWSGGDKCNFQNLRKRSDLRRSLVAPDGTRIAKVDASQIECRILNYVAGQTDKVDDFRLGRDPYVGVASRFYGREITKEHNPIERELGKTVELSAGYGAGDPKLTFILRTRAGIKLTENDPSPKDAYRSTHPMVVRYWDHGSQVILAMHAWQSMDWGPMRVECDQARGRRRIILPNGAPLIFDSLHWDADSREWRLKTRKGFEKLYGSKLVGITTQALARVVASQAFTRIRAFRFPLVLTAHDEGAWLIPAGHNEHNDLDCIVREMSRTPTWLGDCPLAAEGKILERYE